MLARRLRRRPNINPALVQCIVFAGTAPDPGLQYRLSHNVIDCSWLRQDWNTSVETFMQIRSQFYK